MFKYNGGRGAIICDHCKVMIAENVRYTERNLREIKCPDCKKGDVIVKKTRKGRQFFGCSRYPDCEFASWKNPKVKKKKSK